MRPQHCSHAHVQRRVCPSEVTRDAPSSKTLPVCARADLTRRCDLFGVDAVSRCRISVDAGIGIMEDDDDGKRKMTRGQTNREGR